MLASAARWLKRSPRLVVSTSLLCTKSARRSGSIFSPQERREWKLKLMARKWGRVTSVGRENFPHFVFMAKNGNVKKNMRSFFFKWCFVLPLQLDYMRPNASFSYKICSVLLVVHAMLKVSWRFKQENRKKTISAATFQAQLFWHPFLDISILEWVLLALARTPR